MKERDGMRERARTTGDRMHWKDYRRSRNIVTKLMRKTRNEYFSRKFTSFETENDTKKIYQLTKELCGWKTDGSPKCFLMDGKLTRKPKEIADLQIKYYSEKMENLVLKLRNNWNANLADPLERLDRALARWSATRVI